MRVRALIATTAAGLALLVAPAGVASAAGVAATAPTIVLGCDAVPSKVNPAQHSRIAIRMDQVGAGVTVKVTAHFKSRTVTHLVKGTKAGRAASSFDIGSAPKGQRVPVTLTAAKGDLGWTCSTSFIPR